MDIIICQVLIWSLGGDGGKQSFEISEDGTKISGKFIDSGQPFLRAILELRIFVFSIIHYQNKLFRKLKQWELSWWNMWLNSALIFLYFLTFKA